MVLRWVNPEAVMPFESWKTVLYAPYKVTENQQEWKAKLLLNKKGERRVEIRKCVMGSLDRGDSLYWSKAALLLVVTSDYIRLSMNGTAVLSNDDADALLVVIEEAREVLRATASPKDTV